jgi:hypothetical protein
MFFFYNKSTFLPKNIFSEYIQRFPKKNRFSENPPKDTRRDVTPNLLL